MTRNAKVFSAFLICFLIMPARLFAAPPPTIGQGMSGETRTLEMQEKEKALQKQIREKKKKPQVEEKLPQEAPPAIASEKVLIKIINVKGVTLIPDKDISEITKGYEGREITLGEMQKMADLITDLYRKKGYITSRAYLPPQKLDRGTLDISVIEGKMGDLTVSGNHHYKTFLFKKKFYELKKSEPFNFNKLTKIVRKINEQPDRTAKAVIVPGKEPGSTDVELQVKDSLPIHAAVDFDNYASVYLFYNRYQMGGVDNNFLGFEDILNVKYMMCEASSYESLSASYLIPITNTMKFGAYGSTARLRLINDAKPLDIYGKSRIMSFYVNQSIVDYENAAFSVDLGFDYKNVYNYQLNNETSRDKMRIAKVSFNLDITDLVGRTILTNEVDIGLPGFMNGSDAKDARTSRPGAGGEFVKYVVNLLRLQQMPLDSNILWTNQLQVSSKPLTATEEYQLGGIANLRGYPPAELVGDYGLTTSVEWAFPPYFIPKNIKIPFAGTTFYDAIRIVAFYDYGNVRLKRPLGNEKKNNQLSDVGWGFRVNLPKMLTMRFDFAWALDKKPSDGSNEHTWVAIAGRF